MDASPCQKQMGKVIVSHEHHVIFGTCICQQAWIARVLLVLCNTVAATIDTLDSSCASKGSQLCCPFIYSYKHTGKSVNNCCKDTGKLCTYMHAYPVAYHECIGVDLQLQQDWGCNKDIQPAAPTGPAPAAPVGPLPIAPYMDPSAAAQLAPVSAAEAADVQKGLNLYHVLMSACWLMQRMHALCVCPDCQSSSQPMFLTNFQCSLLYN